MMIFLGKSVSYLQHWWAQHWQPYSHTVTASRFLVHYGRFNTFSNHFCGWCDNYQLKFSFLGNCLICMMMDNAKIPATFSYCSPHTM